MRVVACRVELMSDLRIREARPEEHGEISALALRSKGHWGYSAEFLEACRDELTFDAATCGSGLMWVVEQDATVLGFSLVSGESEDGELSALFIDPPAIGTGCGRMLLEHTLRAARAAGFTRLELDADPGAEAFYLRFGARRIGTAPSGSVPGRVLPRLEIALTE
ncbi:GNAT family N-acetyltransferase [Microbacterium sp. PMB16]|uniref:GNAT family N-acetyltransferase n=1 Tax=Microbacterium sp. PMB16 TaxID=3120157 RepID=UPI003F4B826D